MKAFFLYRIGRYRIFFVGRWLAAAEKKYHKHKNRREITPRPTEKINAADKKAAGDEPPPYCENKCYKYRCIPAIPEVCMDFNLLFSVREGYDISDKIPRIFPRRERRGFSA